MRKKFGLTLGGLQHKLFNLVLVFMIAMIAVFGAVSYYQSKKLTNIVKDTRTKQQQSIEDVSRNTMHQVIDGTMVRTNALQAYIADDMFGDVKSDVMTLQTLAQGVFNHKDTISLHEFSAPDASNEGKPAAQAICESGVDYKNSRYLGIAAHMSDAMVAMFSSSDKLSSCFIALSDGTCLCVDEHSADKIDDKGNVSNYEVRTRPWYKAAVEKKGISFSGIYIDSFTKSLCMTCSIPVYVNNELIGVVGADLFLDSMADYVKNSNSDAGCIYVVSDEGKVIFSSDNGSAFKVETSETASDLRKSSNKELADFITSALKERTKLLQLTVGDKDYYACGAPMSTVGWTVITMVDKQVTEQPAQQMIDEYDKVNDEASKDFADAATFSKYITLAMILFLLILGTFSALWLAGKIVKPIESMTGEIIEGSQTGKLFEMKDIYRTKDEIQVLAESFDDLSKKTKKYIEDITQITAEKERISTELSLARRIQEDMLPNIFPPFPDRKEFDIYARMTPAKEVGGDFYDFYLIDDDHLGMVIADVSGKGVPAALFMMMSRILIKNYAMIGYPPAKVLELTNNAICMNNKEDMFVTAWYGVLEISTGKITASNAGHEFPVVRQPDGSFELFKDDHSFIIGGMEGMIYSEYEFTLQRGGTLFVYTDGVPEATRSDNQMFKVEGLLDALNKTPDADPKNLLDTVRDEVNSFVGDAPQFDDLTMLGLKLN